MQSAAAATAGVRWRTCWVGTGVLVALCTLLVPAARADAVVLTRAMTATTIAEIFLEETQVRVEISIGMDDLPAFANLLPDGVRESLGFPAEPLAERLVRFFTEDFSIRPDDGPALPGYVLSIEARPRIVRDEITGDPLPNQPADAENVAFAELVFPLDTDSADEPPQTLSIRPPRHPGGGMATLGFVLYHRGLPVNDFRYLSLEETVDLDWEDPWYSRFRNRNLWRQFSAPLSVYLYVEPYEVRKEVVIRPIDLQRVVDIGLQEGQAVLRADDWGTIQANVAAALIERGPVLVDGRVIEPVLDRVHFIERTLRTSRVLEEPEELDLLSATLGVIITYPINGLPEQATLTWDLFPERITEIPGSAVDEVGGLRTSLTPDDPVLRWQNFLKNPTRARLVELDPPPAPATLDVPVLGLGCLLAALGVGVIKRKSNAGRLTALALALAALPLWPLYTLTAAHPMADEAALTEDQVAGVCGDLLRNVYRAFDFREESDIHDVLARSTEGELLTDVYLETRRSLELENQGGARARVQEVEVLTTDTTALPDGPGFRSLCTWTVAGAVGHWGHIHQRRNRYDAELTVEAREGEWKITGLELLDEVRL